MCEIKINLHQLSIVNVNEILFVHAFSQCILIATLLFDTAAVFVSLISSIVISYKFQKYIYNSKSFFFAEKCDHSVKRDWNFRWFSEIIYVLFAIVSTPFLSHSLSLSKCFFPLSINSSINHSIAIHNFFFCFCQHSCCFFTSSNFSKG